MCGAFAGERTAVYSMRGSTGVLLALRLPIDTPFLRTQRVLIGNRDANRLAQHLELVLARGTGRGHESG